MKVIGNLTRVYLPREKMNDALAFYESVFGERRFRIEYEGLDIASVGPFFLCAGSKEALEPYRDMNTIVLVDSLSDFKEKLLNGGAEILSEPRQLPTGLNMIAKHPDGSVVEYVEPVH